MRLLIGTIIGMLLHGYMVLCGIEAPLAFAVIGVAALHGARESQVWLLGAAACILVSGAWMYPVPVLLGPMMVLVGATLIQRRHIRTQLWGMRCAWYALSSAGVSSIFLIIILMQRHVGLSGLVVGEWLYMAVTLAGATIVSDLCMTVMLRRGVRL